ncbi:hypothetical protein C7271_01070 [filamentous cyanobacterium CCP5]|nr:hypothetical protein C7271_01070 [filamentous cyanobacterium CCP5]
MVDHYVDLESKYNDLAYQTQSLGLNAEYTMLGIQPETLGMIDSDRWMRTAQCFAEFGIIDTAPTPEISLASVFWPAA